MLNGKFLILRGLPRMALSLLVVSMIIMIVSLPRPVSGETAVSLSPRSGTAGTLISVVGAGFDGQVIISLGSTELARTYASNMFGRITQTFKVPSIPPATYTITATDARGTTATTTFTVTSTNPTATSKSSSSPSITGNNNNPVTSPSSSYSYYSRDKTSPSPVEENDPGFWSLPVIGITAATIITTLVLTLVIVSRRGGGRPDKTFEEEPAPPYRPEPRSPPRTGRHSF